MKLRNYLRVEIAEVNPAKYFLAKIAKLNTREIKYH